MNPEIIIEVRHSDGQVYRAAVTCQDFSSWKDPVLQHEAAAGLKQIMGAADLHFNRRAVRL